MERFLLTWPGLFSLAAGLLLLTGLVAVVPPAAGLGLCVAGLVVALAFMRPAAVAELWRRTPAAAAIALALGLAGCATLGQVAASTVKDEQAAYGTEAAFKALRVLAVAGVDSRSVAGDRAARGADLLARSYSAAGAVRAAYLIGSADTVQAQALSALALMTDAQAVIASRDLPPATSDPQPRVEALQLIVVAIAAAPQLGQLLGEFRAVVQSQDPAFIRARTLALEAENDAEVAGAIGRLRAAALGR